MTKPLDDLEAFVEEHGGSMSGEQRIELHRLVLALQAPIREELQGARDERDAARATIVRALVRIQQNCEGGAPVRTSLSILDDLLAILSAPQVETTKETP